MAPLPIPLARQTNEARALPHSCERLVNLYAEKGDGKDAFVVHGTPGFKAFAASIASGVGALRGACMMAGTLYAVVGTAVYSITSAGAASLLPGVPVDGSGRVSMDTNGTQLVICTDQDTGYIATTASVVQVVDPDFPGASVTAYLDGYSIYIRPSTDVFFISDIDAAGTIVGTDFATAEARADNLVTCVVANRLLWLFGEDTTEVWFNAGTAGFPLARINGSTMEVGCASRFGAVEADNAVFFISPERVIYRAASDFLPRRVSTHAIEDALRTATVSDCETMTYEQGGHEFVAFLFLTDGLCFVYDAATGLWHERESYGLSRWRPSCIVHAYGKVLAGDHTSDDLWELDLDTFAEGSDPLVAVDATPIVWNGYSRAFQASLFLDMEVGVGLNTGQGSAPRVMMEFTNDGGKTWSAEFWRDIGPIGSYGTRIAWHRLGMFGAHGRAFRFTISDPVKRCLMGAYGEIEGGRP